MTQHIVIIGNGIAGITCARNVRKKSNHKITVISSETKHFYSRTALMYVYMGHMKYKDIKPYEDWFWEKNRIELIEDHVTAVDVKLKSISLRSGSNVQYDKLVIATGSKSNLPDYLGINLKGVQTLYGIHDVEQMNANTRGIKRGVIVGGGLIGIEMAEMLLSRNIHVTFLIREPLYWQNILPEEEAALVTRHIREHYVDLRSSTELQEIIGDDQRKVTGIITKDGETIDCEFVGITTGVSPNISFLKGSGIQVNRGVLVNRYFETNIEDVYAIGDCVEHETPPKGRKQVEQVWYTGRMHGETLADTLCGTMTAYNPGPWFNSAKFFDIEYQTYGKVDAKPHEDEDSIYWEHKGGKVCLRIVYNKTDGNLIGINALGLRIDHKLTDKWINNGRHIDEVIADLKQLNFDPELYEKFEDDIISLYNKTKGKTIKTAKKRSFAFFSL